MYGHRAVLVLALGFCATGALMTLAPSLVVVAVGLSLFAAGVFIAQAASSSHVAHHAPHGRALALGLYTTFYYVGGSIGGAVPALLWKVGGWPACVAFLIAVQLAMLAIAWNLWRPQPREVADFEFQPADSLDE